MNKGRNIASVYALTPLQEGILYHALKSTSPALYMGQYSCEIHGEVDSDLLQQSWRLLFERHACLRTLFVWRGQEQPVQIVRRHVDLPWTFRDWSDLDEDEIQLRWRTLQREDREQGFKLDKAPLARLVLVRQARNRYRFYFAYHHLLLDGWSLRLLLNQVPDLYQQIAQGGNAGSGEPDGHFADYVDWLAARDWRAADAYWAKVLGDFDEATPLPLPPPERVQPGGHAIRQMEFPASEVDELTGFVRSQRLTLNVLFLAAWALVIGRYAERDDVVFGTATAGRPLELAWSNSTVGLFINTLALRIRLPAEQLLGKWLQEVQARHLEVREYEHSPLVRVQRASGVGAGSPLFESLLVFQSVPEDPVQNPVWSVHDEQYLEFGNYPLAVLVRPGSACTVSVVYDAQRFSAAAVERLLGHLHQVIRGIMSHVDEPLHGTGLLTAAENERLLDSWAGAPVQDPPCQRIGELIARHYRNRPEDTALLSDGRSVSYAELDARVSGIAMALHEMQIGSGHFGVVFLQRGIDAIAAMLAIQRVGGAYVPMDPEYPPTRIQALIDDLSRAADSTGGRLVVMSNADLAPRLDSRLAILDVTRCAPQPGAADTVEPGSEDSPAYVMYTSGSTGQPKGVLVSQANLVSSTLARNTFYPDDPARFLLLSSLATDSSIAGLFWTLSTGGTLVLPRAQLEQSVDEVAALIRDAGVTHLLCLPSLYSLIIEHAPRQSLQTLRCAIVAGEACDSGLRERHHARLPDVALYNEYGPSETTVWATAARIDRQHPEAPVPIGRPVSNTRVYVLDRNRRLVPPGIPGELYIGGGGVAEGYLGRDPLTDERFFPDPFATASGGRVYRTGDRVRFLENGDLQFLGRVDEQIKVRGFRVEPDEIVRVIMQHPDVTEAVVVLSPLVTGGGHDSAGRGRLVAFFTSGAGRPPAAASLRAFVAERLPNHMVPQHFVPLEELPKTPGGKIDRQTLMSHELIDDDHEVQSTYVAPTTKEQQALAAIWCDVLGVERVGIHDDFFELGGDSLLSIRILARASQAGMEISPALFFERPTIAAQVEASSAGGKESESKAVRPSPARPSAREMLGDAGLAAIARQLGDAERGGDSGTDH